MELMRLEFMECARRSPVECRTPCGAVANLSDALKRVQGIARGESALFEVRSAQTGGLYGFIEIEEGKAQYRTKVAT